MSDHQSRKVLYFSRLLIIGFISIVIVPGLAVVAMVIGSTAGRGAEEEARVDALATSKDECVVCHREETPGIVLQFGHSTMAAAEVTCRDCHEVEAGYPGAVEHEGDYVLAQPTTAMCQECHEQETEHYLQSRHSLPAYVAYNGSQGLTPEQIAE